MYNCIEQSNVISVCWIYVMHILYISNSIVWQYCYSIQTCIGPHFMSCDLYWLRYRSCYVTCIGYVTFHVMWLVLAKLHVMWLVLILLNIENVKYWKCVHSVKYWTFENISVLIIVLVVYSNTLIHTVVPWLCTLIYPVTPWICTLAVSCSY